MRQAIINRISRRSFTGEPFTPQEQKDIVDLIDKANAESGLSIEFVENGGIAFSSIRKSYGMFKNVRSLLLMKGNMADKYLKEKIGYYGEDIILNLTDMGFGSCWVGGTFDKDAFETPKDEELACVIVIGKVEDITIKEKIIRRAVSKSRKPVEGRLAEATEIPAWVRNGIEAVRLAPSAMNTQKVMFRYDGTTLTIGVNESYAMDLIDLGIAKRHFESEVNGHFALGNDAAFFLDQK